MNLYLLLSYAYKIVIPIIICSPIVVLMVVHIMVIDNIKDHYIQLYKRYKNKFLELEVVKRFIKCVVKIDSEEIKQMVNQKIKR